MTHRGRTYGGGFDHDEELATLALGFDDGTGAPLSVPLTSAQAGALVARLQIYRDNGDATFGAGDTLVSTVSSLALVGGVQTVTFVDGDSQVQVVQGTPRKYFAVIGATGNASTHAPGQLRLTHVVSGSTAEDRAADLPLVLEYVTNVSSGVVTFTGPVVNTMLSDGFESGNTSLWTFTIP